VVNILDKLFEKRVIVNCDHDPYLNRWYVFRTKHVSLFIHQFVRSDEDRALHDHPWNFLVIPIWRGYIEHSEAIPEPEVDLRAFMEQRATIPVRRRVLPIIGTRFRFGTYRHRVELLERKEQIGVTVIKSSFGESAGEPYFENRPLPAWSLFFHFTKFREWGFWPNEGFTPWNKWWQDKCE
jgi:hypothetical protein